MRRRRGATEDPVYALAMVSSTSSAPAAWPGEPIPRSIVTIGLDHQLRARLGALSRGRTLAIGFYTSRCCSSVAVGDLTVAWVDRAPAPGSVALAPVEGVPVVADRRLIELLRDAGPTLVLGGPVFARRLALRLERPELWIDFLGRPAALRD